MLFCVVFSPSSLPSFFPLFPLLPFPPFFSPSSFSLFFLLFFFFFFGPFLFFCFPLFPLFISFYLSIFLVFCFAVYGALASEILTAGPGAANFLALNEAACAVALLGTSFALSWIMMAKGSKAWYEVYERYIFEIEQEEAEGLKIPERYRLGALCRPWEMNGNLFSKKAGRYSPSRLNITIGSVTLTA